MRLPRFMALCVIIMMLQVSAVWGQDALALPEPAQSVSAEPQHILLLNTYEIGLPIPDSIDRGFITGLKEGNGSVKDLFIEHLDLARETSSEYRIFMADLLRHKLAGKHIGIVIAQGIPAVNFLNAEAKELFPDAQVLTLITPGIDSLSDVLKKIIDIPWHIDASGTLQVALDLFPKTRRVVVVTGSRDNILPFLEDARKAFAPWENTLDFEYTDAMTYEQMLQHISSLPPDSIIIYSPYFSDTSDRSFVPAEVVIKICQLATAPVFSTLEPYLGHGIVGGSLLNTETMGAQAAKVALDYLHGRLKLDKPITSFNVSTKKMFDWNVLTRWGANISALPEDSIVINRPHTLWGQYNKEVTTAAIAFSLLCLLILTLWVLNRRLKRLTVSLSDSESHYRSLFENSLIGVTVTNKNFIITNANDAFCKMLEYSREELVGKMTISDVSSPDDAVESMNMVNKLKRHDIDHFPLEKGYVSKTGKTIPTLIYVRGIYNLDGEYEGTTASILDITERKKADDLLCESNEKFTLAFNNAPIIIAISKLDDGTYLDVNQRFIDIFGFSRDEVIGKSSLELGVIKESQRQQIIEVIKKKGKIEDTDLVMHTKSGKEVLFKYWGNIIMISQQERLLSISLDITEHRRIEQQLQQAQKMEAVGQLAGGVAHDFNNMLGVIIGYSELILEQVPPSQQFYTELEEICKAARRSADLTRQLLTFARKQTVAPKVLDLNQTIEGMLNMLRRLIGENINLIWMPGTGLWSAMMDPSQVDQILANLCVNARDAIAGMGKITVETENATFDEEYCATHIGSIPGEYVRIALSDTGNGMDKETLAHIFEPFFTTKGVGEGTGLGLATVYGAVKQNNGFINAYSEPGQGTTFTIYIPRHVAKTTQTRTTEASEPILRGDEIIMLVEDEPTILNMTKTILERLGYTVLTAGSPNKAIRMAGDFSDQIHLLATDVIMPEMNGRELAECLMESRPEMKSLYMSGYTANIIANQGVLKEGVSFIRKPFSKNELAAKVREALES